jgi:hypothetical protein
MRLPARTLVRAEGVISQTAIKEQELEQQGWKSRMSGVGHSMAIAALRSMVMKLPDPAARPARISHRDIW